MVRAGQVSATLAMATLRQAKGDGAAAVSVLTEAVGTAQAAGKSKATAKHVAAPKPDTYLEGFRAAYRQWQETGAVQNPDAASEGKRR